MVKQAVCLQPLEDHVREEIYPAAWGGTHAAARWYGLKEAAHHGEPTLHGAPGRNYRPWREACTESPFFLLELGSMGDPLWSSLFLKAFPMKGTHAGATPGELQPMGRTSCCSSYRTVSCCRGPMLEQEKSVKRKKQQRCGVMN